jgi:hypothetical protein
MGETSQPDMKEEQAKTREQEERSEQAQQVYCDACEESGLKVSSWQDFGGWKEFVDGSTNEASLTEKAQLELAEFAKSFGKFLVIEKEEPAPSEDADKQERVKRANRIYRKLCEAAGLTLCFFTSFSTWKDYVEGRISESEFLEQAKLEIEKMVPKSG